MNRLFLTFTLLMTTSCLFSQVGVGTSAPNDDAILDVVSTDKGILIPRISLTETNDAAPLSAHVAGMIIFNTATSGTAPTNVTPGFYYSDGSAWIRLAIQNELVNIYNANGTLLANRTVSQGVNTLAYTSTATTGTSHFTVDASTFNIDAVNNRVGLGTNVPSQKLHVLGGNIKIGDGSAVTGQAVPSLLLHTNINGPNGGGTIEFQEPTDQLGYRLRHVTNDDTDGLYFERLLAGLPARQLMTLRENGRVGIGTANPSSVFNIVNDDEGTGPNDDFVFESYNSNGAPALAMTFFASRGRKATPLNLANNDLMGEIYFGGRWNNTDNGFLRNSRIRAEYRGNGSTDLTSLSFFTSGVQRVVIAPNGNVGFGVDVPDFPIHLLSGARVTAGGVWTNASDARLKSDISNSHYGLKDVLNLRPVEYVMNVDNSKQVGFIAQEVIKIVPEVVSGIEGDLMKNETLSVSYGNLVPVLTKAIQELNEKVEKLTLENKSLKSNQTHYEQVMDEFASLKVEITSIKGYLNKTQNAGLNIVAKQD